MRIHFIAMGGAIMHQLAIALSKEDNIVTGSDDKIYGPARKNLINYGILPDKEGWFVERITEDIDCIILGMHAKLGNPELLRAQELNLAVYSFPEFVFERTKKMKRIVVAGSHGKTTITSMILHVLVSEGLSPNYLVGADIAELPNRVALNNNSDVIVIEGDEYLASALQPISKFHFYDPDVLIISGIAWDHINVFPTFESYVNTFQKLIDNLSEDAIIIAYEMDVILQQILSNCEQKVIWYNIPQYKIDHGKTVVKTMDESQIQLDIFGKHNLQNTEAAKFVCAMLDIHENQFYSAIEKFQGASNRLQILHRSERFTLILDFAHAPSKVKASTNAVCDWFIKEEVIAVFELHTYSSLQEDFIVQYKNSMDAVDQAIIFIDQEEVIRKDRKPIHKEKIISAFGRSDITVLQSKEDLEAEIQKTLMNKKKSYVLLMMSSGRFGGLNMQDIATFAAT